MASAGGHWKRGDFVSRIDRRRRAYALASDMQGRMNRLLDQIVKNEPVKGYYNAKENKRRTKVVTDLRRQMDILRNRKIGLNNVGAGLT